MKLLFDENLSFRLAAALADIYPGSVHVREAGLLGADDLRIWDYAAKHGFSLLQRTLISTNAVSCMAHLPK